MYYEIYEETFDDNCTLTYNKTKSTLTASRPYKGIKFSATLDLKPYIRAFNMLDCESCNREYDLEFVQDDIIFYKIRIDNLHHVYRELVGQYPWFDW